MVIIILCIMLCPPLLILALGVIGIFFPVGYIALFLAWFTGLATVLFTAGALLDFDITNADDWKWLAASLLIPGSMTAVLVIIGKWIGDFNLFDLLNFVRNFFG